MEREPGSGLLTLAFAQLLVCWPLNASGLEGDSRSRVDGERAAVMAEMDLAQAQCEQRFAVTACVDEVRRRRRDALAPLRLRELELDDAERQARVARRLAILAAKSRELPVMGDPEIRTASGLAERTGREGSVPPSAVASSSRQRTAGHKPDDRDREAAERVRTALARQAAARATQAEVARRLAERAQRGKPFTPLPVPAAEQASSAAAGKAAAR